MFKLQDISVVIPTYNRSEDLIETIRSFDGKISAIEEVLIIDQSPNNKTKKAISNLRNKKIKYIHSVDPSLTKARNLGIRRSSKKSKIIIFFDDDITLDKNYFEKIIEVFNQNENALGVGGHYFPRDKKISNFEKNLRMFFLIEHVRKDNATVLSSFGAVYPDKLTKTINSMWIPGFNMAFRKEVFDDMLFDENLSRYALAEDFDFTYRISKKFPKSLFITPGAKLIHRVSSVERYPTEKSLYMNQINHFYLNFKNFNSNYYEKIKFIWCIFGISILRAIKYLNSWDVKDSLKLKYHFESLIYCVKNLGKIKKGELVSLYKLT